MASFLNLKAAMIKQILSCIVVSAFMIGPLATADTKEVPLSLRSEAFQYAGEIAEMFPADKYFVISLGTSQIYLDTALELLIAGYDSRDNYFRELPFMNLIQIIFWPKEQAFQMLDKYFPTSNMLNGRRMVIIRALFKSDTLKWFYPLLNEYFKSRGHNSGSASYLLAPGDVELLNLEKLVQSVDGMDTLVQRSNDDWFEYFVHKEKDRSNVYRNGFENVHRYHPIVFTMDPWPNIEKNFPPLEENFSGHRKVLVDLLNYMHQHPQKTPQWIDERTHLEALMQIQSEILKSGECAQQLNSASVTQRESH